MAIGCSPVKHHGRLSCITAYRTHPSSPVKIGLTQVLITRTTEEKCLSGFSSLAMYPSAAQVQTSTAWTQNQMPEVLDHG